MHGDRQSAAGKHAVGHGTRAAEVRGARDVDDHLTALLRKQSGGENAAGRPEGACWAASVARILSKP